jgi:hypothetical protein
MYPDLFFKDPSLFQDDAELSGKIFAGRKAKTLCCSAEMR